MKLNSLLSLTEFLCNEQVNFQRVFVNDCGDFSLMDTCDLTRNLSIKALHQNSIIKKRYVMKEIQITKGKLFYG